jgi:Methyltransferase domain/Predicted methyltransferase regulatory domain
MTNPAPTIYDEVAYPSAVFLQTHPNRLALLAQLHGLSPPPIDTARVLEIGGGDGMNLLSMASAFPDAQFFNFDLAPSAVEKGHKLGIAAGLTNFRCEVGDITAMDDRIAPGSYDYVIVHGVYAWVPDFVREATMALVSRALSKDGVAFVSFNTNPGGHVRMIMRDMMLHLLAPIAGIKPRIAAARQFLTEYQTPREGDDAVVALARLQAVSMLGRPDEVLFHDELGDCFNPQTLTQVVEAANANGLQFLTDAGTNRTIDGFVNAIEGDLTAIALRTAQTDDYIAMRFFRQVVLVRGDAKPVRKPDVSALMQLYITGRFHPKDDGVFEIGDATVEAHDPGLVETFAAITASWPRYVRIDSVTNNSEHALGLLNLFHKGVIFMSTLPERFTLEVSERPVASPVVRAQIAQGDLSVVTLAHEPLKVEDEAARGLIVALDGTNDRAALGALWATLPHHPAVMLDRALDAVAYQRLMFA